MMVATTEAEGEERQQGVRGEDVAEEEELKGDGVQEAAEGELQ
jgi:hypothetical protein